MLTLRHERFVLPSQQIAIYPTKVEQNVSKYAKTSLLLSVILVMIGISPTSTVYARTDTIWDFGGNCHDFSVDIQLPGLTNDGNGLDRFRYQIIDGSGVVLYQEEATRPVGESGFSEAINLPYQTKPT